ncbi:MAG: tetratricopeptide repeat protein [Kiritimatiellaeota bacterium]|nr:tetratricopeptide repeat protein [Kiritimatiellota bacterium]
MAKKAEKKSVGGKTGKLNDRVFKEAVDDFDRFEGFVLTNLKTILIVSAVLAAGGVISAFIYHQIEKTRVAEAANLLEADTVESITTALSKHPDNLAANVARMRMATLLFNKKDFSKSMKLYKTVAAKASAGELRDRAALNVAYTLEAMGEYNAAAEKFSAIAHNPSTPSSRKNEAGYSAARLFFHLGKIDRAKSSLKSLAFGKPGFWAAQGKQLSKRL